MNNSNYLVVLSIFFFRRFSGPVYDKNSDTDKDERKNGYKAGLALLVKEDGAQNYAEKRIWKTKDYDTAYIIVL